jgi:predicted nucleic acid-binding protein
LSLYLDASVLLPTLINEAGSASVDRLLGQSSGALFISEFAVAEVASALSRSVRTGRLDDEDARERLNDFDAWRAAQAENIDVESTDVRSAGLIVRQFDLMLRTPDALHIAICHRLGASMATLDRKLAAASATLGLSVAELPTG